MLWLQVPTLFSATQVTFDFMATADEHLNLGSWHLRMFELFPIRLTSTEIVKKLETL